jgi:multiple sugar transport system ATP-binding protein
MAHVVLMDLVKTYGVFNAVNKVSLTVDDGEFVALVGPSGCGKTTTLNLVAGLIPVTSGKILIGDRVVNDLDPKDRDIAMVFQNYALYPQKSVYKNLAFPLQMRKLPRDEIDRKVKEAARVLGMTELLERKPRELSGGQQQRVALGRALVRDPAVFLMDEPLSNLDAKLRVQMRSEIKRFHQDLKATIIYVTHDQLEAVTMADKMAVMNGGYLLQYDSPAQVFAHPVNMFVASFIGSPAMSLIPLEASTANGDTVLTSAEGWSLELSPDNARKVQRATRSCLGRDTRRSSCTRARSPVRFRPRLIRWSQPETSPSCRCSSPAPSSTSACHPTLLSYLTRRSGSSSTRSARICSTAKLKWPSRPTETERVRWTGRG